jgi:hypothetical protein
MITREMGINVGGRYIPGRYDMEGAAHAKGRRKSSSRMMMLMRDYF